MKLYKNVLAGAAAAGLLATQAAAAAPAPAARTGAAVEGEGLFGSDGSAPVLALISVFVLVGLGMLIFDDNDDEPVSP